MTGLRRGPARLHVQIAGEWADLGAAEATVEPAAELEPLLAVEAEPGVWTVTDLPEPSAAPHAPNARPDDARPTEDDHRPAGGHTAHGRALP